jgi:hypothetical protein
VAKAAAAMDRSQSTIRSEVIAPGERSETPGKAPGTARALAADKPVMTSTPHKRKGDEIAQGDKMPKTAANGEEDDVFIVEEVDKDMAMLSREEKLKKFMEGMQSIIDECHQFKTKVNKLLALHKSIVQDAIKMASEDTRQLIRKDKEYERSSQSVMLFNVHKIKFPTDDPIYARPSFEGKLREELHSLTRHRIQVRTITVIQRTEDRTLMTVRIRLGAAEHRGILYSMLALNRELDKKMYDVFKAVSFRDSLPYEMLGEVRKLSAEGMEAKRVGKIVAFRVSAQGAG